MPRPKTDCTRINMYLPNKLINVAKRVAKARGISYSQLTRTALKEYLLKELSVEKPDNDNPS